MSNTVLLRIAAFLSGFFGLAHTLAWMNHTPRGAEEAGVFDAMRAYRFGLMGVERSHWDFYDGFGWLLSAQLAMGSILLWNLGGLAKTTPAAARGMMTAMLAGYAAIAFISWRWFFPAPAVMTTLAAACIALALWNGARRPSIQG
jgi:hypothetical protein